MQLTHKELLDLAAVLNEAEMSDLLVYIDRVVANVVKVCDETDTVKYTLRLEVSHECTN